MELRQLRHFIAVGEEGSITAAARKLRLTQPALSRQIKALEEELATELLERGAHSIQLTPAGELLVEEGRKLVKASDAMVARVKAVAAGEPLRVGYAPSLAGEFLSLAISRFTQFHPRARVSLFDWSSAEMRDGLACGKLDLIVAAPCEGLQEGIRWIPLRDYRWQVVMPEHHALAGRERITAKDLDGAKLLLYDREHYPDYWEMVTSFFRSHRIQAKIAGEFDGISSLAAALEGGLGIALLAESSGIDRGPRGRVVARSIAEEPTPIAVAAGISATHEASPQLQTFIEELRKSAQET